MKRFTITMFMACMMLTSLIAQNAGPALDVYFSPVTAEAATPDNEGFIRRWLLLEPIDKPNRSNIVFTDSYLREAFNTEYFKGQLPFSRKTDKR